MVQLSQLSLQDGGVIMAAMVAFPSALCLPQVSYASAATAVGTHIGDSFSYSISQPVTTVPFSATAYGLAASFDGASHFSLAATAYDSVAESSVRSQVKFTYLTSVVNVSDQAQDANFAFNISRVAFDIKEDAYANTTLSFAARVYLDSSLTPIWESGFSVNHYGGYSFPVNYSYTANESGESIGLLASFQDALPVNLGDNVQFAVGYLGNVNVGRLDAGSTLDLRYEVDLTSEMYGYGGSAGITFDDPVSVLQLQPIPEPSAAALLAAGLALIVPLQYCRRRRFSREKQDNTSGTGTLHVSSESVAK